MTKTDPMELRRLATADLITYLQHGVINVDSLARSFNYRDVEIDDFDRLLRLHFVLHDDVINYVAELQERLRRIKTEHRPTEEVLRGEVRGVINWNQTFAQRMAVGYDDRSLFVVNDPTIEIDIPENRILKKLLGVIEETLTTEIEGIDQDWTAGWEDAQIVQLQQTLAHNVYLNELPRVQNIEITDRELTIARSSRHDLYAEGARLYRIYDDLLNKRFHRDDVQDFLRETIITPVEDFHVFELFCLFGVIRWLRHENSDLQLRPIESGDEPIARLEDVDTRIEVYYNTGKPLEFFESYPAAETLDTDDVPQSIYRHAVALEEYADAVEEFISRRDRHGFYEGRPDFLIITWNRGLQGDDLKNVIIGEVKYTKSPGTFSTGLRELLEYLHLARESDSKEWILSKKLPDEAVKGFLCTDGVKTETEQWDYVLHWDTQFFETLFNDIP